MICLFPFFFLLVVALFITTPIGLFVEATSRRVYGNALFSGAAHRSLQQPGGEVADLENILVPVKPLGDPSCPCLTKEQLPKAYHRTLTPEITNTLGEINDQDLQDYGFGCEAHDISTTQCAEAVTRDCLKKLPLPPNCDQSWCRRSFCYVDPLNCRVDNTQSKFWPELPYSYATSGHMDSYTDTDRLNSLKNKTLRVGFNSNTGGWKGAYNPEGHFAINGQWDGPLIQFFRDAALRGGFELEAQAPPDWLWPSSQAFFGNSKFDFCVYATSLGYLDLCVASYTITPKRASVATCFELSSDPAYLVTFTGEEHATGHELFLQHLGTVFSPFTFSTWMLIVLFVLPLLGVLTLLHEYGAPGSAFHKERPVIEAVEETSKGKEVTVKTEKIPIYVQICRAIYMSFLGVTSSSYEASVTTMGGKIHMLAVCFFVMLIVAVYTANLAAILTTSAHSNAVESLDEAIMAGYNFCINRKLIDTIHKSHKIPHDRFVPDPMEEGGDGMPGFNCGNCGTRSRTVDFMKQGHGNPTKYCDAAIMTEQDLQVFQQYGLHCNKTVVGNVLTAVTHGIPIAHDSSKELTSWLYKMKYEGLLQEHLEDAEPNSQCAAKDQQAEGVGLTIQQLTGIWVIVFAFALTGLIVKALRYLHSETSRKAKTQKVLVYDQWGLALKCSGIQQAAGSRRGRNLNAYQGEDISELFPDQQMVPVGPVNDEVRRRLGASLPVLSETGYSPTSSTSDMFDFIHEVEEC